MAEINKVLVYADAGGNPQEGLVDSQRRVVVFVDGMSQQASFSVENTNVAVPDNIDTTIVSYTVPTGFEFRLTSWSGTGEADGKFILFIDGVKQMTLRNSAADRNVQKECGNPLKALAGQTVAIKVRHSRPQIQEFSCTIEGFLI